MKDIASGGTHRMVATYVQSPLCWGVHTGAIQAAIQEVKDLDDKVPLFPFLLLSLSPPPGPGSFLLES